jgi:hypothetical protein
MREHVIRMEEMKNGNKILVGKPQIKNHYRDIGIDGRKILQWNLEE